MNNEYVIINKTERLKRIEELEKAILLCQPEQQLLKDLLEQELFIRKEILSQSTPLIPEIKKSYTKGFSEGIVFGMNTEYKYKTSEDYISNLKLDI